MKALKIVTLILACLLISTPQIVLAWGGGHNILAVAVAERLPEPWRSKLLEKETLRQFIKDNHYPDNQYEDSREPRVSDRIDEQTIARLTSLKITKRDHFHYDPGRAVAFEMMVEAIRADRSDRVFFWLGVLLHSTADMSACNHDPLVHVATYFWGNPNWKLDIPPVRKGVFDLGYINNNDWSKEIFRRKLDAVTLPDDGADGREALLRIMLYGFEGTDAGAPYGRTIVESGTRWATDGKREDGERLTEALSELGVWAAVRTLRDFNAALRLAATDEPVRYTDDLKPEYDRRVEQAMRKKSLRDDALAAPLLTTENGKTPNVFVLTEPVWRMQEGVFGFTDRVLACQIVGTLRKHGYSAVLFDVRAFVETGIPETADHPLLVIPAQWRREYRSISFSKGLRQAKTLLEHGGKILWIGGVAVPGELCPPISKASKLNKESRWPLAEEDFLKQKIVPAFDREHPGWKIEREPYSVTGWDWPHCRVFLQSEGTPEYRTVLQLQGPTGLVDVAAAWPTESPRVVSLPRYAVFPYILTTETPKLAPLELELDSAGTFMLLESVRLLIIR